MPKTRRPKPPHKKVPPPVRPPPKRYPLWAVSSLLKILGRALASTVRPGWHAIVSASVIVGLVAFVVGFWPRMTVTPSGLFDESNAYSETFTVANTGFLPFEDVQIGIGICTIETAKHDFSVSPNNCEGDSPRFRIGGPPWWTPQLRRDETFSIVLSEGLNVATEKYRAAHPTVIGGFQMMSA
jgi:hypothetical protein